MKQKLFSLLLSLIMCMPLYAQEENYEDENFYDDNPVSLQSMHSVQLTLPLGISYMYEQPLGDKFSLCIEPRYYNQPSLGEYDNNGNTLPANLVVTAHTVAMNVGGRLYYNRQKRYEQERSIQYNAGNFLFASAEVAYAFLRPPRERHTGSDLETFVLAAPVIGWGLKRSFGSGFFFDAQLGIGYAAVDPLISLSDGTRVGYFSSYYYTTNSSQGGNSFPGFYPMILYLQARIGYVIAAK